MASQAKNKHSAGVSTNSLYDNPMTRSALKSMNPKEIENYKRIGEKMYGGIDFEQGKILNNSIPPFLAEPLKYIKEGLRSGLHPSDLPADEIRILEECLGKEWYIQFGYVEGDLKDIITVKKE